MRFKEQERRNLDVLRRALAVDKIEFNGRIDFHQPVYDNMPGLPGGGLRGSETFFDSEHMIRTVVFNRATEVALDNQIKARVLPLPPDQSIQEIAFSLIGTSYGQAGDVWLLPTGIRSEDTTARFTFILNSPAGGLPVRKDVDFVYELSQPESGKFALDWLKAQPQSKVLLRDQKLFPALRSFWADVAVMDPRDALQYVRAKDATARNNLSFFGLTVDRRAAVWISPTVTILILLFLVSHLRHVRLVSNPDSESLSYPWVGIFRDWVGAVMAYLSICIVPVFVNACLIVRSGGSGIEGKLTFALVAAVAATSVWAFIELRKLRLRWLQ
jgi:hypothetical protein